MAVKEAIENLNTRLNEKELRLPLSFKEFLDFTAKYPKNVFRNIFQMFSDMIVYYMGKGESENIDDPDLSNFIKYDCSRLFVDGTDTPFIADLPFANRLINLAKSFRSGAQRNKIYIFEGPTGCGKSTFLNNLLMKFEEYSNLNEGLNYEILWKIDKQAFMGYKNWDQVLGEFKEIQDGLSSEKDMDVINEIQRYLFSHEPLEVPCPSHDNPILIIPKHYRRNFIDKLINNKKFKEQLFTRKEYEWVFKDDACTICTSLYQTLVEKLESTEDVFKMINARKIHYNRRLGEGISVFNPGDRLMIDPITNPVLQKILNNLLKDSNAVRYVFSTLARTNNGIFSIMDVKSHNKERLMNLHGIISDNIHKVEHIEERVNSLFIALMNPEDKDVIESVKSLGDRIMLIPISYVLDYKTEVEIYHNKFGIDVDGMFLPRVLENFAKVVISSRIRPESEILREWVKNPENYSKYCDKDLLLLKMDLYSGQIPSWLSEEDRKNYDSKVRRAITAESEKDGQDESSISGRQSIEIFNDFYSKYAKEGKLIDMSKVNKFFNDDDQRFEKIPDGFLESLITLYNYNVLQEIKESLYYYNEKEISRDILNYIFALNFETGTKVKSVYTGNEFIISEEFLKRIEDKLTREGEEKAITDFRKYVQREYTSVTLTKEIGIEKKDIKETALYKLLLNKYQYYLKEDVLNPFLENDNFRNAIKDFGTSAFNSYDKYIIRDVKFLIKNLNKKFNYSMDGAKQICIYVIDNSIPQKFAG